MEKTREHLNLAARQHGVLSRRQLDAMGMAAAERRRLVANSQLVPIGPQTFRIGGSPQTREQRILGACFDSGGAAACRTGARLHRIGGFSHPALPEVLVARPSGDVRIATARVHSTRWLPDSDIVTVDGIPTLSVARCLLSLAALAPRQLALDHVKGAVDDAVDQEKATDAWLWWHLERIRRRGRNGVSAMERILELRAGGEVTESWLERETLRVIRRFGLPTPICQNRIERRGAFAARVDFNYEAHLLVIEVSGYRWHRTKAQMARDLRRRRELTLLGYRILEYDYDDIVATPERVAAEILEALSQSATA